MRKEPLYPFYYLEHSVILGPGTLSAVSAHSEPLTLVDPSDINTAVSHINPTPYFLADSDHDGIIDKYDIHPQKWDATDRDLRFAQELAYRSED